jgi:SAM-dependent methyltransferase
MLSDKESLNVLPSETTTRVRRHFSQNTNPYVDQYRDSYQRLCEARLSLYERTIRPGTDAPLRLLDVGCGGGMFADLFLERFPNASAYCVDASAGMILRNARVARKMLILADARELPLRPCRFDLINIDAVLHHVIDEGGYERTLAGIQRLLGSLRDYLTDNGVVLVREIYHEYYVKPHLGSRMLYGVTTAQVPSVVVKILKNVGVNTANAGVCFLTRQQCGDMIRASGLTARSLEDHPWKPSPYRYFGFRSSGDLYYILSPAGREYAMPSAMLRKRMID